MLPVRPVHRVFLCFSHFSHAPSPVRRMRPSENRVYTGVLPPPTEVLHAMNIITRIESIRAREHEATIELIAALVACDRTGAHLAHGYGSIWEFLVSHLKYSNAAASRRYKAMKCARLYPEVLPMLRKHQINLSTLAMVEATLAKSSEPHALLRAILNKSQRQVEEVLAQRNPVPRKKETVRRHGVRPVAKEAGLFSGTSAAEPSVTPLTPEPVAVTSAAEVEERVHLSFSVSAETYEDFERAKAILSRKLPEGVTLESAFEEFLAVYLKHRAPKKRKQTKRSSARGGRYIPVAIRDEVFSRDEGRCTFVGAEGHRCESHHDLEIDHIEPYALGGRHELGNLRLLCASHNRHRAKATFQTARGASSLPQRNSS